MYWNTVLRNVSLSERTAGCQGVRADELDQVRRKLTFRSSKLTFLSSKLTFLSSKLTFLRDPALRMRASQLKQAQVSDALTHAMRCVLPLPASILFHGCFSGVTRCACSPPLQWMRHATSTLMDDSRRCNMLSQFGRVMVWAASTSPSTAAVYLPLPGLHGQSRGQRRISQGKRCWRRLRCATSSCRSGAW